LISTSIRNKQVEPPPCDDRPIWDVWMSVYQLPALTVAEDIGLFAFVAKRPATAREIAESLSLKESAVEALAAVMTSLGFLVQRHGMFSITEVSRYFLLADSPYYWGELLRTFRGRLHTRILEALGQDKPPAGQKKGKPIIDQWKTGDLDPDVAKMFTQAMHSHSFPAAMGVVRRGNFEGVKRLLDAGGGSGSFCIAFALRHPEMRFTILELPPVAELAKEYVARYGLQDQIEVCAADMLRDPWPSGHDAVFFSDIFHDWDREGCIYLARRSYEVLPPGGRIYVHEMLLEDTKDGPLTTASYAISMLVTTKGKQFTAKELDDLLRECGFEDVSVIPTYSYYSLVSARKP
jgi:predicted O-methyltransferase YrrM